MVEIVVATNNEHKMDEYKEILHPYDIKLYSLRDQNIESDPDENGKSFKENAYIKANNLVNKTNKIILSDDSGIIIDDIADNFPGIYSRRYAESLGGFNKSNYYLTKNYHGSKARFKCIICIMNLKREPLFFEGICEGNISSVPSSINNGFGYDPIFIPRYLGRTYGELTSKEKNEISHRAMACKNLVSYLKKENLI